MAKARIITILRSIHRIDKACQVDSQQRRSAIDTVFDEAQQSAISHYVGGFERGWRTKILDLFERRKPIPVVPMQVMGNEN